LVKKEESFVERKKIFLTDIYYDNLQYFVLVFLTEFIYFLLNFGWMKFLFSSYNPTKKVAF